jgi:hypothetical protein
MIVNTCSCGLTYTLAEFRALRLCGVWGYRTPTERWVHEARDCVCGSSRVIDVTELGIEPAAEPVEVCE